MLLLDPEDEGTMIHLKIKTFLPSDTVPYTRRLATLAMLLGETQTSFIWFPFINYHKHKIDKSISVLKGSK
jgi:hypothetical protein